MAIHPSSSHTLVPALGQWDHVIGSPAHRIHVVQYGDFECPSCAQAYPSVKILLKNFGEHLCFAFRHFPLIEAHPHAELAAEAAETAGAQGKFWPMHDWLFENRDHLKAKSLRQYAAALDLDMLRYDAEMADHFYLQRIRENIASGRASGVQGSPAFFINGSIIDVSFGIHHLFEAITARIQHRG
ncbi:DsbA family protein [Candidimonas sp. SYP-B2681]|uniref:DsbA family protein n=1 Tax=Candidimonas sp. SYP-B2681 TaxID=2497686 RepID=UPI000F85CC19|nr:thioredoxin domain-containing protein [Candidimonas sp. SYP-B2681]RTZ48136.1 DsbA family protein [Candidimonas sp. SYP-B2681]